jgi:hypothetical protein
MMKLVSASIVVGVEITLLGGLGVTPAAIKAATSSSVAPLREL